MILRAFILLGTLFGFYGLSVPSYAKNQNHIDGVTACYSNNDYAAEQMIRFHSQLMVIGMICQSYSVNGTNSYALYQTFSKNHQSLIRKSEQTLINLFTREKAKSPEKHLHELRTNIANEISQYAMNVSPEKFCTLFMPRLDSAMRMNEADLNKLASIVSDKQESTRPLCFSNKNGKKD